MQLPGYPILPVPRRTVSYGHRRLRFASSTLALFCVTAVGLAQTWETIPVGFDRLPGNAAVSMPLRWSRGAMQVVYDDTLIAPLAGLTLTHLRLRRPSLHDDGPQSASTARLEVSIGESVRPPSNVSGVRSQNTMRNEVVVLAAQSFSIPATPAPGQAAVVGPTLLTIPFSQPYAVPTGFDLLLEIRAVEPGFTVHGPDQWVDAVWQQNGATGGLALSVGQRGCGGTTAVPMRLAPAPGFERPRFGQPIVLRLSGARPGADVTMVLGLDPLAMQTPGPFGSTFAFPLLLPNCQLWAPWQFFVPAGAASVGGGTDFSITLPASPSFTGIQLGAQALVFEPTAGGIATSSGVVLWMDSIGVGNLVATALFAGDADQSPWPPFVGLVPVIDFGH